MSFIKRELDKLETVLGYGVGGPRYAEIYAARQALAWALDPEAARSPFNYLTDAPTSDKIAPPCGAGQ